MNTCPHMRLTRVVLFAALLLATGSGASAVGWPMFHGDPRHSGFCDNDAPYDSLLAWSFPSSDSIFYSSPVVAQNGTIYTGNLDKELLAISPFGHLLWRFRAAGNFRHSTPAIGGDGTIYVGGADGNLYAINPDSTRKWTFSASGAIKTSPNIAVDGTIYFGADDGRLYAVNPDSTLKWTYPTGDTIRCSPTIAPDGTILVGSMDFFLYAIWPDGALRWRAATGDAIKFCSPAVTEESVIYFGSYDGFLYAVTLDQEFLWAYDTGHVVRSSPAIGPDGTIYVGSSDKLLALDPDGVLIWDYDTDGLVVSSPVYFGDDDVICVGSDDGAFYCIHDDGSLDWTFTVGSPIRTSPAPGIVGNIYVADLSGVIWAFGVLGTSVDEQAWSKRGIRLRAAPNPSCGWVTFRLSGSEPLRSPLIVRDAQGRRITTLRGNGVGPIFWNGRDEKGRPVTSGTYFFSTECCHKAERLTLIR